MSNRPTHQPSFQSYGHQTIDCDVQDITYTTTLSTSEEAGPEVTPEAVLNYVDDTVVDVDLIASISAVYND